MVIYATKPDDIKEKSMGIREDAVRAFREMAERDEEQRNVLIAGVQAKNEEVVRENIAKWASDLGYPGQAVVTSVEHLAFLSKPADTFVTSATFHIDDVELIGTQDGDSFKVHKYGSGLDHIPDLATLGMEIFDTQG